MMGLLEREALLVRMMEYTIKLEAVVKEHYKEHQDVGCTCERCEKAERVLASIGHAGSSGSQR